LLKTRQQHLYTNIILCIGISILMLSIWGCSSEEVTKQMTAEQHYQIGMSKFKSEDYLEAIDEFKIVGLQYQGTRVADAAQFYMGECHFFREEYVLAAYEYDVLIRTMPSSPYVSRARFQRATCYYNMSPKSLLDQDYSKKAVDEYQAYLDYFPKDTLVHVAEDRINELNAKAAKKEYENGITYMHLEYYRAAAFYFDMVLEKYHDTPLAEPAQLKKAEAMMNRKKFPEAQKELDKFLSKYPHSELLADAEKIKTELRARIAEALANPPKEKPVQAPVQTPVPVGGY
jgi:outer membrane protein assembly factor BamD